MLFPHLEKVKTPVGILSVGFYVIMHHYSTLTDLIHKYSNTAMHKYGLYRGICVVFVETDS